MSVMLETLGWAGMVTFVIAYYGVSSGKLKADGKLYQWMNFGGAIAVGSSVFAKQAWPAFVLEVIWGAIALMALIRLWRGHKE
jgi:hypothetical protein